MKKGILFVFLAALASQCSAQTQVDPALTIGSTGSVTFNYQGKSVTVKTVRAEDGYIWLQQNLGSTQVGVADNDTNAYGHYFQWGRWDDGHQLATSPIIAGTTLTPNSPAGLGTGAANFYSGFWSSGLSTNVWSGQKTPSDTLGKDPCTALGADWHIPTADEYKKIYEAEKITDAASAFKSNLKLVKAGYRTGSGGLSGKGSLGLLWNAQSPSTGNGSAATFAGGPFTHAYTFSRGSGAPCRCMKVTATAPPTCNGTPSAPTIITNPAPICSGNTIKLDAQDANTGTGLNLQWQQSATGSSGWSNVSGGSGAVTLSYTTPNLVTTTYYRIGVTCTHSATTTYSPAVKVTVDPNVTPILTIVSDASGDICAGVPVKFSATGINGGSSPVYQWRKGNKIVGTNSTTYTDNNLTANDLISCVITSSLTCLSTWTATSNLITIMVHEKVSPRILVMAEEKNGVCQNKEALYFLETEHEGSNPNFQWLVNKSPAGSNTPTFSYTPSGGDEISCILTSNAVCASPAKDTSDAYSAIVHPYPTKPEISKTGNELNSSAMFDNQWYRNGTPITGATSSSYPPKESGYYQVEVTNEHGCNSRSDSLFYEMPTNIADLSAHYGIRVYPSPFKENIQLDFGMLADKEVVYMRVVNQLGQEVFHAALNGSKHTVELSSLARGLYFVQLSCNSGNATFKITKE